MPAVQLYGHEIGNQPILLKKHTTIYLQALGYNPCDFIPSEISGSKAIDIHHIECKGMGGNPIGDKDRIENLQALTREEHDSLGDKSEHMAFLFQKHMEFLDINGVKYDREYLLSKIEHYKNV